MAACLQQRATRVQKGAFQEDMYCPLCLKPEEWRACILYAGALAWEGGSFWLFTWSTEQDFWPVMSTVLHMTGKL